jgi:hypothetical protein
MNKTALMKSFHWAMSPEVVFGTDQVVQGQRSAQDEQRVNAGCQACSLAAARSRRCRGFYPSLSRAFKRSPAIAVNIFEGHLLGSVQAILVPTRIFPSSTLYVGDSPTCE